MRKKELLRKVSKIHREEEFATIEEIDMYGREFYIKMCKVNFVHAMIYIIFILGSLAMYPKINHLSFIPEDFYINLITGLLATATLIAIIFFTLYIYNKKKNNVISSKKLTRTYRFYQIYDLLSFVTIFLTIFLWLLIFMVTPVEVSGTSMENTFNQDDKLLVWHIGYNPKRNDVVIIDSQDNYPRLTGVDFIVKRVIAVSGDVVTYEGEDIYVNGNLAYKSATLDEFQQMLTLDNKGEIFYEGNMGVVPEGYTIVLGDNRINSYDSKSIGLVYNDDIIGKCIMRIFPLDKFGFITK